MCVCVTAAAAARVPIGLCSLMRWRPNGCNTELFRIGKSKIINKSKCATGIESNWHFERCSHREYWLGDGIRDDYNYRLAKCCHNLQFVAAIFINIFGVHICRRMIIIKMHEFALSSSVAFAGVCGRKKAPKIPFLMYWHMATASTHRHSDGLFGLAFQSFSALQASTDRPHSCIFGAQIIILFIIHFNLFCYSSFGVQFAVAVSGNYSGNSTFFGYLTHKRAALNSLWPI